MIDFKRLITGFLILAALASSSAFVFSGIFTGQAQIPQDQVAQVSANADQTQPQVSPNAFVEPLSDIQSDITPTSTDSPTPDSINGLPAITQTSNLTQNVVQVMAHDFVATNPNGPQDAGDGTPQITEPDVNAVIAKISKNVISKRDAIPDWGADADTQNISVIQNATVADEMKYETALQDIYDKNFSQLNVTNPTDPASLNASVSQMSPLVNSALNESKTVQVPAQLVDLHKSGLTLLSYTKNLIDLSQNTDADPLKSYIILQEQEKRYAVVATDFSSQLQKAFPLSDIAPSKGSSIFAELFGVQTAHAQYSDISALAQRPLLQILQQVWQTLKDTLLQVLINTIITQFENDTLNWIRNGGNPFAVTNWQGLLEDAAKQEASAQIDSLVPNLCSDFVPLIKISLKNSYVNNSYKPVGGRCTLDQLVGDIKGFYNGFQNGGWFAYGVTILPSSNYYAMKFLSSNIIAHDAQNAANASQNAGVSSRGLFPMQKCPAGYTLSGTSCLPPAGNGPIDPTKPPAPPIPAQITTPGGAVADTVAKALGAKPDTINNAKGITGILITFAASVINTLVAKGASLL